MLTSSPAPSIGVAQADASWVAVGVGAGWAPPRISAHGVSRVAIDAAGHQVLDRPAVLSGRNRSVIRAAAPHCRQAIWVVHDLDF
jgi:hypothetical protein